MIRTHSKSGRFIALLPDDLTGGYSVVATSDGVASFAASWPCNGLPVRTAGGYPPIRFDFAANGDLVDVSLESDSEALGALSEDASNFGSKVLDRKRAAK